MADSLEVGMKLHAKYSDGEFYPAIVEAVSTSQSRKKAPVKVAFVGYEESAWKSLADLKSKRIPKQDAKATPKAKAKAKAKEWDYSGLEQGMKLKAESDGTYYAAEVVTVSTNKAKSKAPVKVHFVGYTNASDEWVGGDRLRSKALAVKKPDPSQGRKYSLADQVARFERAQKEKHDRYLNIHNHFDGSYLKGKRVLVVGGNRGLGLNIVQELSACGAETIVTSRAAWDGGGLSNVQVIAGIEVTDFDSMKKMCGEIKAPLDYVIFVAGYFPDIVDNLDSVQEKEAIKQIDVCALGPLRCVAAMKQADQLKGVKVAIISSQAGSTTWRFTQNKDKGGDYGHHMSRAACNIGAVIMSEELKSAGVPIVMLHPGFNRTEMTKKYEHIWDKEGAVDPKEGAKRVLFEVKNISMKTSGQFINCEDGLQIPW